MQLKPTASKPRGMTLIETLVAVFVLSVVAYMVQASFMMNSRLIYDTARQRILDSTTADQAAMLRAVPITKLFAGGQWDVPVVKSDGTTSFQTINDNFLQGATIGVWFLRPSVQPTTNSTPLSVYWRYSWTNLNNGGAGSVLNLDAMVYRNGMTNVVRVSRSHEYETLP